MFQYTENMSKETLRSSGCMEREMAEAITNGPNPHNGSLIRRKVKISFSLDFLGAFLDYL